MTGVPPTPIDQPTWRLPWEMAELHGWFLKSACHVMQDIPDHEPVRFLEVCMTKNGNTIEVQGNNDMDVWRQVIRRAEFIEGKNYG